MRISDWSSDVCSSDLTLSAPHRLSTIGPNMPSAASLQRASGSLKMSGWSCLRCPTAIHDLWPWLRRASNRAMAIFRSEERRVGKECVRRVDLGGRRNIKNKLHKTLLVKKEATY